MEKSVILIYPKTGWDSKAATGLPLSVLYLAGPLVQSGYRVRIIDQRTTPDWQNELKQDVQNFPPICVGISSMTGRQIKEGLEIAKVIKNTNPQIPIVWGGVHPSLLPEQTINSEYVDVVVIGDGEGVFLELVNAFEHKDTLHNITGICYKEHGNPIITPLAPPVDINRLPDLPFHLIDVEQYITSPTFVGREVSIITSRGCPHRCAYCYNKAFHHRTWRGLQAEKVVTLIKKVVDCYHVSAISLHEDNFFVDKPRVEAICHQLIKEDIGVKFRTSCRVDYIVKYDIEFLEFLRRAGFVMLYIGVESGSKRILNQIKKDITLEDVLEVNYKLKKVGIVPKYSFMAGFPGETIEDIQKTMELMVRLVEDYKRALTTPIQLFSPYPGTELFDVCIKNGMFPPLDLSAWSVDSWNKIEFPWLSKREQWFLENASYFTIFLDGKTIAESYHKNPFIRFFTKIYGQIVRFRIKNKFYALMPEIHILRFLREYTKYIG